jgi:hypothetical protein
VFQVGSSAPRFRLGRFPRLQNVCQIWGTSPQIMWRIF